MYAPKIIVRISLLAHDGLDKIFKLQFEILTWLTDPTPHLYQTLAARHSH